MPRGSAASTASGMLSDLKSRLGFSRESDDYEDDSYDDFDEYDDFDDDGGYNDQDDREYAGYGSDYNENAPVGGYSPATTRSGRFGRADSTPDLVSIEDVKERTRSSADTSYTSRSVGGRDLIDDRAPAQSSPAYNASLRDRERNTRSGGLDSLFEPSSTGSSRSSSSFTPYTAQRSLTVVRPISYADAERVAKALKAGDMVVLAMRSTPSDLVKRVLDFSFGAASVLDASVESPAEKVFAISKGAGLTEDEKRQLRGQGVL